MCKPRERSRGSESESSGLKVPEPEIAETIPFSGIRKTIAERLSYSFRTAVPAMVAVEVDMGSLIELREKIKEKVGRISMTAFIVKAVATALESHPLLNSTLKEGKIVIYRDINISIAINTPRGLYAPVIRHANKKSVIELSDEIRELTEKALRNQLAIQDLLGGTFTITNLGPYGVDIFIPIINPPQSAILGIGRITKKPVVIDDSIVVRPMATLCLVFDHRIVDGVPAAEFLGDVKRLIENPQRLVADASNK